MATTATRARRRQRREESRTQILAAADAFLQERPYRELTVDELMVETGFARTVFYRHFADLPDMVLALMQDVGRELLLEAERLAEASVEPERIREGLRRAVAFFARSGPLIQAAAAAASHDDAIERAYAGILERFVEVTETGLRRGLALGVLRPLDPRGAAEALTALNERHLLRTLGRRPQADPEAVFGVLWTIWRRTLYLTDEAAS